MDAESGPVKRLFVAVPLPGELVHFVERTQRTLGCIEGVRLLDAGQLHCTVAFIGESDGARENAARRVIAGVDDSLGGVAMIDRLIYLPSARRPQVVALGVDDGRGVLGRLFDAVMTGVEMEGVMQRDSRPYRPHITIARLRRPGRLQPTADCGPAVFGVESVCLYSSELRSSGAVHREIERKLLQIA